MIAYFDVEGKKSTISIRFLYFLALQHRGSCFLSHFAYVAFLLHISPPLCYTNYEVSAYALSTVRI